MTDSRAAGRLEALARLRADLTLFSQECLKVKAKSGDIVPLIFNKGQVHLHQRLEDQKRRTGKVRALLGKGRQFGGSTAIGARFYHTTSMRRGIQTFILTHEQDATDNLFNMVERFHKHCPLRPSTALANAKELYFDKLDSGYAVGTARTKAVGRSRTVQQFHGSEVAFWPNAKDHFAGVVQAIPDLPGTEIVLESTGNGVGGEFHERWQMAEAGIGDYEAIFIPWFWSSEYSRIAAPDFVLDEEEREYARLHRLSLDQMSWRRAKLAELKDPALFLQEYPATAVEMFQATGHNGYIKAEDVLRARKATCEGIGPLVIGADPARSIDRFSLAWRKGRKAHKVESRTKISVVEGATWLKEVIDRDKPAKLFIDLGGLGVGVYDILHSWGEPYDKIVVGVNFGSPAHESFEFLKDGTKRPGPKNRRAEMWKRSRDWLQQEGGADIPDQDSLQADACAPGYGYDPVTQHLILESKEKMEKRGVRSPDEWDALALTFAEPVKEPKPERTDDRPRVATGGSGDSSWLAT